MEIPAKTHPIWRKLINDEIHYQFSFLAAKILLTRVKLKAKFTNDPQVIEDGIKQLHGLFTRYQHIPGVVSDLERLFNGGYTK